MKFLYFLLTLLAFLFSCKNDNKKVKSNNSIIFTTKNDTKYDSDKIKYNNIDTLIWYSTYYSSGNIKTKTQIYFDKSKGFEDFVNQKISFSKNGDTLFNESFFYRTNLPDTVPLGKTMYKITLFDREGTNRDEVAMCVKNNYGKQVFIDSFFNSNPKSNTLKLGLINITEGSKNVDGFILQSFYKKNYMSDSIISVNKIISKMFFQEPIYVLDDRKNLK